MGIPKLESEKLPLKLIEIAYTSCGDSLDQITRVAPGTSNRFFGMTERCKYEQLMGTLDLCFNLTQQSFLTLFDHMFAIMILTSIIRIIRLMID